MKATTIKAVIRKRSKDEDINKDYQIYIRITKNNEQQYLATGIVINGLDFDQKAEKCKEIYRTNPKKSLLHKQYNVILQDKINDYKKNAAELSTETTAKKIAKSITAKNKLGSYSINQYFTQEIEKMKERGERGNAKVYSTARTQFFKFFDLDTTFAELDDESISDYSNFLKNSGQSGNSIVNYLKTFRALYNRAIVDNIASKEKYRQIFEDVNINSFAESTKHRALSDTDINNLKNYKAKNDIEQFALDIFFFSYFNQGINFKDIALLTKESINNDELTYYRSKTGSLFLQIIHPESLIIIERWQNESNYICPILSDTQPTAKKIHNRINRRCEHINYTLTKIGNSLNINNLTTYVARHSFASKLLREGAQIEKISQALGHQDLKTTKIYLAGFPSQDIAKLGKLL